MESVFSQIMSELAVTARTRHSRLRDQGSVERADLVAILRAGFVCHLGVIIDGYPMVVPTVYGIDADVTTLYLHGSVVSRSLLENPETTVCVTVTHIDGLVLARSVFEHGVNYRSAMVFGSPRLLTEPSEKLEGLRRLSEHAAPGQWAYARQPSKKELAKTSILALGSGRGFGEDPQRRAGRWRQPGCGTRPLGGCHPDAYRLGFTGGRCGPATGDRRAAAHHRAEPRTLMPGREGGSGGQRSALANS